MLFRAWGFGVSACLLLASIAQAQPLRERLFGGQREPGAPRRVVIRMTPEAFAPIVDRDVDETRPVQDVVLGTAVVGKSRTTGKPKVDLLDDDKCASFVLTLKGTTVSRTVGHNGPAVIHSRSETEFTATKRVVYEPGKGFVAAPAKIDARTRIITEGLGSTRPGIRGRIVERRAAPQVAASRPAAEEIVRQKAMRRVSAAFDRQLAGRLERLNRMIEMREAIAFVLAGQTEPRYSFCTRNGCVEIVASTGAEDDSAAAVELPQLDKAGAPVQIWVHESLVGDNVALLLKQFDLLRREPGDAISTLEKLPAAFQPPQAGPSTQSERTVDYATAEDWIVVLIQPPEEREPAKTLAAEPSGRPTLQR
jgi:hypothetical protein